MKRILCLFFIEWTCKIRLNNESYCVYRGWVPHEASVMVPYGNSYNEAYRLARRVVAELAQREIDKLTMESHAN